MNLIIGFASGIQEADLEIFIRSFEQSHINGTLVLFVDKPEARRPRDNVQFLRAYPLREGMGIDPNRNTLLRLWKVFRWYPSCLNYLPIGRRNHWQAASAFAQYFLAPHCYRYFRILTYLSNGVDADHILLTDVRDVVFQADPFLEFPKDRILCAAEVTNHTMGTEIYNTEWYKIVAGEFQLKIDFGRRIFCSGTTAGPALLMVQYLEKMVQNMMVMNKRIFYGAALDQAVHNLLINTGAMPPFDVNENRLGPILTLSGGESIDDDESYGCLRNRSGGLIPVIHQFDRIPILKEKIKKHFSSAI